MTCCYCGGRDAVAVDAERKLICGWCCGDRVDDVVEPRERKDRAPGLAGRSWTDDEDRIAMEWPGTMAALAEHLGRTIASVHARRNKLRGRRH